MAMAISMAASCSSSSSYLLIKRLEGGPRLSRQSLGGAFHLLLACRSLRSSSLPYSSSSSSVRRRPFVSASASAEQSSDGTNSPPLNGKHGFEYDLVTIGAGSGGVRASRFAANFGAKVAICELPFATISSDTTGGVGGTCVLRGCVPKKLLVFGSKFSHDFEECKGFGWSFDIEPKHDWSTLIAQKNAEIRRLTGVYKNVLANSNVGLIEGRGKIVDPHTVEINGKHYTTNHILVAVGGRAVVLDIPGKEFAITSDEALDLPSRPDKISIIGGGYIALEFASIFNGLGTEVHVYIRQKKVLRGFDEEIRDFIADQMALRGVNFHFEESPLAIEKAANGLFSLKTTKGTEHSFSHVMFGTGRAPNTKNLGLEEVGVKLNAKGAIEVDQYSKTNIDSIWAVGDVTDRVNLTPVAIMEGGAFARNVFGGQDVKSDHGNIPCAVFTQPPIGSVGLTEEQAIEQYGDIDVFTANFRPMKATLSGLPDRTFMKLIVDATSDRVVGAHMCGEDAAEILQGVAIAVKAGLTKSDFDNTVGIHPTAAEELVTMRTPTRVLRHKSKQTADVEGGQVVTSL